MNRGIARRTVFENDADVRYFLAQLARAVRAGGIEVHAYCLMTTHFHLLVRSPAGGLSTAMRAVQNEGTEPDSHFHDSRAGGTGGELIEVVHPVRPQDLGVRSEARHATWASSGSRRHPFVRACASIHAGKKCGGQHFRVQ
jgi:hypothetical protein